MLAYLIRYAMLRTSAESLAPFKRLKLSALIGKSFR